MNMDWIFAIIVGALIGWLASLIAKTDAQQGALSNILIGMIGAALGRWLFGGVLGLGGAASAGAFSVLGLFWGVLGALVLIVLLRGMRVLR
jgi:uncharacterized membrane protein YeaQ/YmgE (transglycosylase-associated protein family)